ncbi:MULTISPECIES: phage tail protein [unclassified Serratia (in: enterobacteria)]|uniref:phage tail-collar fiber domain-containing protein n=1 Tax=unclassified Serratia (in: enterobacteria) TaxID=2647522 RepID=UPI0027E6645D|nr:MULTISPECIES: phage tail protein [unclassified Serratia (in: enterobacteria)]MDQ7098959.1 phage tail protein [Serratia sp. MF2]MDQ7105476.1 phage tail protein [Serratia sp. MF1(2023)]
MSKYKAIITTAGAAKIAAASAGGTQLKIVRMAVGDGNGTLPTPNPAQTKLVNEKYRAALNGLTIDKNLKNHILAEMIIPANVGGFWLREMGLYDEAGTLIALSNMAESYKPKLEEGSGRTQTLRMILIVSSTDAIQVIAGGDTVLATKDYVTDAITAHEKTRNHPDASTTAKGLVQLSSATTSTDETKASTPKALKTVSDASLKKDANLSDLTNKAAARGNLALGDAATRNVGVEGGQLMAVGAFGLGVGARAFDNAYCNTAQIYRLNATSENKPSIAGNIAAGVLSLPCDAAPSTGYISVSGLGHGFIGRSNRPENGVVWSRIYTTDYKPTAADVGAWSKTEADGRFVKQAGDTMTGALTLPRVVFPNEGVQASNADSDLTRPDGFTLEQLGDKSVGYPLTKGNLGNLMTFKLNKYRHVQFAIGSGNTEFWLRSPREDNPATAKAWAQVYTTHYKPTAADVGALTDAQAAQKYALRSIKVNGKPLSADVNLLAGDVNAWNKTEADGRYLAKTGGQLTGTLKASAEIQSTNIDNYRMVGGGFGSFWRNDGNRLYLLLTKENDQYGTFNTLRPFSVDVRTGAAAFESGIHIGGNWPAITTSSGTTWHPDGNVQGSAWGGYLSEWLKNNINGRVDWGSFANRTHEGSGWWRDENTGILLQYGRTYTKGINESANLWQSFNIPFTQWVGPILMTPAWPDRSTWDQYYDYGVQLGSHNTQGFNWNKQCYSNDVRTDWDSGMTWFAIGK